MRKRKSKPAKFTKQDAINYLLVTVINLKTNLITLVKSLKEYELRLLQVNR